MPGVFIGQPATLPFVATTDGESVGNTAIETVGPSIVVPAGTLDGNKQVLVFRSTVNFRNVEGAGSALTQRIKFAGLTLATFVTGTLAGGDEGFADIEVSICRTSPTAGSIRVRVLGNDNAGYTWEDYADEIIAVASTTDSPQFFDTTFAVTWTNANTFEISADWTVAPAVAPSVIWHHSVIEKKAA